MKMKVYIIEYRDNMHIFISKRRYKKSNLVYNDNSIIFRKI